MAERTFSRRSLLAGAALGSSLVPAALAQDAPAQGAPAKLDPPPRPRTVLLVRHGEKAADDPRDPTLSEAGKARAAALLRLLGETRVTHVFTSELKRTRDFAAPVAAKCAVTPAEIAGKDLDALVGRLAALPEGSIALVVGHSNTLPAVAKGLGGALSNLAGGKDLRDEEYDRFAVLSLAVGGATPSLLELRYGA